MAENSAANDEMKPLEDFQRALGRYVLSFQMLETQIKHLICFLIDHPDGGLCQVLTAELAFKNLLHVCFSVFDHIYDRDDELKENLKALMSRALRVGEERNAILHSEWLWPGGDNLVRVKYRARLSKFRPVGEEVSAKELAQRADRIDSLTREIGQFIGCALDFLNERKRRLFHVANP